MNKYIKQDNILDTLDISKGDIILVGSDITNLVVAAYENDEKFDANKLIDNIKMQIGDKGTLLFPTYNWDFCQGQTFDYHKTMSKTGALSKAALKRPDFTRTQHPIYSFAVWGKDSELLFNLSNKGSFSDDSPFAYLHKERAKMLMIGVSYQDSFTFVHHVEEMEKVDYRYSKDFTGRYIDFKGDEEIRTYSMYVRDLGKGIITSIDPIGEIIDSEQSTMKYLINGIDFRLIDLGKAYETIRNDIRNNNASNLYLIEK